MFSRVRKKHVDYVYLGLVCALVVFGLFTFLSAALGLYARSDAIVTNVVTNQLISYGLGLIVFVIGLNLRITSLQRFSLLIFLGALALTFAVHIPGLGFGSGGAVRWLDLKIISIQPSEILKLAAIIMASSYLTKHQETIKSNYTLIFAYLILGATGVALLLQPDADTFLVIASGLMALLIASRARAMHLIILTLSGIAGATVVVLNKSYIKDRIVNFLSPGADALGDGYQIQQSLIAIGSGGATGKGFGQSIQKFSFIPEPVGDSIFAVLSEEWGFIGASVLIIIIILVAIRGYTIAGQVKNSFFSYLAIGITTILLVPSLINIASMINLFPISGLTLPLVSHGGTSLLLSMFEIGIILNISKNRIV